LIWWKSRPPVDQLAGFTSWPGGRSPVGRRSKIIIVKGLPTRWPVGGGARSPVGGTRFSKTTKSPKF